MWLAGARWGNKTLFSKSIVVGFNVSGGFLKEWLRGLSVFCTPLELSQSWGGLPYSICWKHLKAYPWLPGATEGLSSQQSKKSRKTVGKETELWKALLWTGESRRPRTCPGLDACQNIAKKILSFHLLLIFRLHVSKKWGTVNSLTKHWRSTPNSKSVYKVQKKSFCLFGYCFCFLFGSRCLEKSVKSLADH